MKLRIYSFDFSTEVKVVNIPFPSNKRERLYLQFAFTPYRIT